MFGGLIILFPAILGQHYFIVAQGENDSAVSS